MSPAVSAICKLDNSIEKVSLPLPVIGLFFTEAGLVSVDTEETMAQTGKWSVIPNGIICELALDRPSDTHIWSRIEYCVIGLFKLTFVA